MILGNGRSLPKTTGAEEVTIGYRGHEIPIPAKSCRIVYENVPGRGLILSVYFQDTNKDVGRIRFPRETWERLFRQGMEQLADNKPNRVP